MRHWNAAEVERDAPSVQYPADDIDPVSIMGRFAHTGELFFREKDIKWLQELYNRQEGEEIEGKKIENVTVPLRSSP